MHGQEPSLGVPNPERALVLEVVLQEVAGAIRTPFIRAPFGGRVGVGHLRKGEQLCLTASVYVVQQVGRGGILRTALHRNTVLHTTRA